MKTRDGAQFHFHIMKKLKCLGFLLVHVPVAPPAKTNLPQRKARKQTHAQTQTPSGPAAPSPADRHLTSCHEPNVSFWPAATEKNWMNGMTERKRKRGRKGENELGHENTLYAPAPAPCLMSGKIPKT